MYLYLFGGHSESTKDEHYKLINTYLEKINPPQILFLGFAEINFNLDEKINRFKNRIKFPTEILDARKEKDLKKCKKPLVYVGGGNNHRLLYDAIVKNKKLYSLISQANYYFGDSAGAMLVGSIQREQGVDNGPLMQGLGLLKNTIIEPHFSQKNRQKLLEEEMKLRNIQYGIGIDEATGVKIDTTTFPENFEIMGNHVARIFS